MKFHAGFLLIVWHVAGTACSAQVGGVCLLQLRNDKNPSGEVEPMHHLKADKHGDGENGFAGRDPSFASTQTLRSENAVGEAELEHHVTRGEDESVVKPIVFDEYPGALVDVLETMVVTRWNGDRKIRQSGGVSSPVPGLYQKFDCVRHESFEKTSPTCQTLLIENKLEIMKACVDEIEAGTLDVTSGIFVVFLGTDHFLSDHGYLDVVKNVGTHFQKTYYESYDLMDDEIDVLPIGLSEYYLRFQDWDVLSTLAQNLWPEETPDAFPKYGMVLGAFGAFFPVENPSRKSAGKLCKSHGQETWLTCEEVPKDQWWYTLARFRFLLNPSGGGLQSTKFYEALLARAVPICTKAPAFVKLQEKGWPMVLVDSFSEVKDLNLTHVYEELSPRLASIQQYLHLDDYWNYLHTGHL